MKLTSRLVSALALGAVVMGAASFSSPVRAADEKPKTEQKVSKAAAKPLKAAQDAMNAKDYPTALAKLKEVEALPGKSPYDEFMMNQMYGFVYVRTQQLPEAEKA
ncbi:MAG TPA: hypothetical protein VGO53_00655, partial [Steroidobacteraceae bacterium]|nr:hypothetical protein [Steroidobacteraceae bacterium]